MKLLLIQNPVAGRRKSRRCLRAVESLLSDDRLQVTRQFTTARGECVEIVRDADASFDAVACLGGDGTLHEAVSGMLLRARPLPIGFIPFGTTNDLAASLGLPKDPVKAGRVILEGRPSPMDVGRFGERSFVYIASFGTFSDVAFKTPQGLKNKFGKLAYVLMGARMLRRVKTHRATIVHDGGSESGEYALVALTNARRAAAGFIRYGPEEADLGDGIFELLVVEKPKSFPRMIGALVNMTLKRPDDRYVRRVRTTQIQVTAADGPIPWCVDGEHGGDYAEIDIRVLKRRVSIIQP